MKQLILAERSCLIAHIFSMAFGLAGLLLILPHPELIAALSTIGQQAFQWSMAGGGVVYIILGAAAVSIYAYRVLGAGLWLTFLLPATLISLSSELLGTSTGFPFGAYGYLSGLGYKVAGLVPFTIPLSWFYMGFSSYLLARAALQLHRPHGGWWRQIGAVLLGAILLTAWDFALDPAMSQTTYPFWHYGEVGAFFGTPYQNFAGWLLTGTIFMGVAAFLWRQATIKLHRSQLGVVLAIYLSNFAFAAIMSLGVGIWIPLLPGLAFGVIPALLCWRLTPTTMAIESRVDGLKDPLIGSTDPSNDSLPLTPAQITTTLSSH
ncbi:hypothetical protein BST81_21585 [Leptolyngbya sp. 'hensonii']|uniref:gamma-carotene 1'-hydroxylase CruF n=1 Tax=Leptolyngbya sp. 'hensonii' TaxID=1922337 RepID=UPI00095022F3|nr:carotenoid biosynthesis protein [Leptolyngbya sp. 'hensonii']OLP16383.1 hypothetical protein BST81_21585 [Leptolyngbya sp. 'hensonii']